MARKPRKAPGGVVFHVLNRVSGQQSIFDKAADCAAFEKTLAEAVERTGTRLLAWCLMPNHWHLLVWTRKDRELSEFARWLTVTHTQRWHAAHGSAGSGHLYQGRFKSFPVQTDQHFLAVARYVERNALRAGKVKKAQDWRWCSLWRRENGPPEDRALLSDWPVTRPDDWVSYVNRPQTRAELDDLRTSVNRGRPFGSRIWQLRTAAKLGLTPSLRPPGRPKKRKPRAARAAAKKNDS